MNAANLNLIGVTGPATHVTVWRRLQRVAMRYSDGQRTVHTKVLWSAINALERDLAAAGWRMQIANTCRSEWSR